MMRRSKLPYTGDSSIHNMERRADMSFLLFPSVENLIPPIQNNYVTRAVLSHVGVYIYSELGTHYFFSGSLVAKPLFFSWIPIADYN